MKQKEEQEIIKMLIFNIVINIINLLLEIFILTRGDGKVHFAVSQAFLMRFSSIFTLHFLHFFHFLLKWLFFTHPRFVVITTEQTVFQFTLYTFFSNFSILLIRDHAFQFTHGKNFSNLELYSHHHHGLLNCKFDVENL